MGQVLEVRAGFNVYETISSQKRDAGGMSDPFEILVTDSALNLLSNTIVSIAAIISLTMF